MDGRSFVMGMSALGAAIATLSGLGSGLGQGIAAGDAAKAVGRQPEARGNITSTMLIGCALAETCSIYGLIIALILLLANPFIPLLG